MKRLQKYSALLSAVQASDPKTRVAILRSAPDEFIKTLLEVVLNYMAGNIPHSQDTFNKLKRYKNTFRGMQKGHSVSGLRKKMLHQKGGFLPLLLAPIIAAAVAPKVAGNIASKASSSAVDAALDTVENRVKKYFK